MYHNTNTTPTHPLSIKYMPERSKSPRAHQFYQKLPNWGYHFLQAQHAKYPLFCCRWHTMEPIASTDSILILLIWPSVEISTASANFVFLSSATSDAVQVCEADWSWLKNESMSVQTCADLCSYWSCLKYTNICWCVGHLLSPDPLYFELIYQPSANLCHQSRVRPLGFYDTHQNPSFLRVLSSAINPSDQVHKTFKFWQNHRLILIDMSNVAIDNINGWKQSLYISKLHFFVFSSFRCCAGLWSWLKLTEE